MKKPDFICVLETPPDWLMQLPCLTPWEQGQHRLLQEVCTFIESLSARFYDLTIPPKKELMQLQYRLLSAWVYHWGKKNARWSVAESREYLCHGMDFHPLEEIIFSEALYDRQNNAAVYFQKNIMPYLWKVGERLMKIMNFSDASGNEWMNEFWIFLLDEPEGRPCVILRYRGLVPIQNWLALVFTNHVNNLWRKKKAHPSPVSIENLPDQEGPMPSSNQDDIRLQRLMLFIAEALKNAFNRLDPLSRLRLEYAYLEDLSNQDVANILHEAPSQTTRKRLALEVRLVRELRDDLRRCDEWRDFESFFSNRSAPDIIKAMLGGKNE